MSTYKKLNIKSHIKDYSLEFTDSYVDLLRKDYDKNFFIIIDKNIKKLYRKQLNQILSKYPYLELKASESIKTLESAKIIIKYLIENNIKRNYALVAIGGGTIQDITAFVASILYRGVDWIFYPTTLLAQSDSCIGSKTSINVDSYKNQVGNFYPPRKIYINTAFLKTLSLKDIKSGLGEIIKVHLLDGLQSLHYIKENYGNSLLDPKVMEKLIFRSLEIKKDVIEKDEFDTGYRNIMNYGHTFGHALESLTGYKLCHGQAITIGMDISNYLSRNLGYIQENRYKEMREILAKNWPSYNLKNIDFDLFFKCLTKDKKNIGNSIAAIITKGPGRMFKKSLLLDGDTKKMFFSYFNAMFA